MALKLKKNTKNEYITTRKKVKVIGTEQYINAETGELKEMQVVSVEERDCNFHKLWLRHIIDSLDLIGNQKTRLCFWIIEHLNRDNMLLYTYQNIANETGISLFTVKQTMKTLVECNFLKKRSAGCYIVNPDVIFKGGKSDRMNVLIQYQEAREPLKEETDKLKLIKNG